MAEEYKGIKYQTTFLSKEAPQHPKISLLSTWCKIFDKRGLAPPYEGGSYGNLSFRDIGDSFIITASQSSLADSVSNDRFVLVESADKRMLYVRGTRNGSSEAHLHMTIYKARKDVNAVFHGHCKEVSENACMLGIPTTEKFAPYGTDELIKEVMKKLGSYDFIEMKDHGFISMGKSMTDAGLLALEYLDRCCIK
jgi:ribulose-5-phosphate 4-epimerase/fuculose-1-phosphate aldolase